MGIILVPSDVLLSVADQFKHASNQLEGMKDTLNNQISMLMDVWDGTKRQRFFEDFQRTQEEMQRTINHMQVTSQELRNIAFRFRRVDTESIGLTRRRVTPVETTETDWKDGLDEFVRGLKSGGKILSDGLTDTVKEFIEDPVGTTGELAYNSTIGLGIDVVSDATWLGKMAFDVEDTRAEFQQEIGAEQTRMNEMGNSNYMGEQAALMFGGLLSNKLGMKTKPNQKPHTDLDGGKKDGDGGKSAEGTPKVPTVEELSRAQKRNLDTLDNIVDKHLTEKDFSGTLRDLQGNPVPKQGGGYWNHLQEMQDSYKGLSKIKRGLEGSLQNPTLSDSTRKSLQDALDKANTNLKRIEDLFEPFGGVK